MNNEERFCVIEVSENEFGRENGVLYAVCCSEEEAKEITSILNDRNLMQDNDDYYTVVSSEDW